MLTAERGQTEYGICSTTFLELAFRTDSYAIEVDFHADGSWSYVSDTMLVVHGQDEPFLHRDRNTLVKVGGAGAQPLGAAEPHSDLTDECPLSTNCGHSVVRSAQTSWTDIADPTCANGLWACHPMPGMASLRSSRRAARTTTETSSR